MRVLPQVQRLEPVRGIAFARSRILHAVLNWAVFSLCYPFANRFAQQEQIRRSLASALDGAVPFVPWMILPYASSGLIFTLVFFLVRSPERLRVASRRLLAATVVGSIVFVLFPARFTLVRPVPDDALAAALYRWLAAMDAPYNQLPSLHVAYCVIFWTALAPLCKRWARAALGAWLLLVAASTVFTWQHHVADVAAGLVLGCAVVAAIRPGRTARHTVSFYYAIGSGVLLVHARAWHSWLAVDVAASLVLVAWAYARRNAGFLSKRDGRHPWHAWLLFWPYLAGYRLTWMLARLRDRRRPPFTQAADGLWTGRRLSVDEARQLPAGCRVIDLCGELPQTASLRGPNYRYLPLLDLQAPRPRQLRAVLREIAACRGSGLPVYVHCGMGYSRSRFIARLQSGTLARCRSRSTS
jgi:membrane-associated phospholipid phosphatase